MDQPARPSRRPRRERRPAGDDPAGGAGGRWAATELPAAARDHLGRRLALGDVVRIGEGRHAGQVAEVVGWGGRRGVELVVHGSPPAFLAVPPARLELVDVPLVDPVVPRNRPRPG